jgi:hypothetical protein
MGQFHSLMFDTSRPGAEVHHLCRSYSSAAKERDEQAQSVDHGTGGLVSGNLDLIVPMLCVGMPPGTLRVPIF